MKTIRNYRNSFFALLTSGLLASTVLFSSCDKDDEDINEDDDTYTLSGNASASQEVPSNASTGTGTLTGTYNARTNSLSYTISWTGLTNVITAAHFHGPAESGQTADPLVDITIGTNGTSGSVSATVTLTDAAEVALLTDKMYYNLHTALYPNGEIRGQVSTTEQ